MNKRDDDMNRTYTGKDRREGGQNVVLTEEQIDAIADRAAEKAADRAVEKLTDHVYRQIGKSVISKAFWIIGVSCVSAYFYLKSKGIIS